MLSFILPVTILLGAGLIDARPAPSAYRISARASSPATTPVSAATISNDFVRPAEFSRVAYCSSAAVKNWKCGPPCDAIPGIQVLSAGGDGGEVPFYYIAHDPSTNSVVVAHEGTDSRNILSIANDAQFFPNGLNQTLFPGSPAGIQVHDGFQKTFERTADGVLSGVKSALASTGAKNVAITGHSLGAAISTMDALMLRLNLDPSVAVSTTVFGLPRGGNQAYADFIDKTLGSSFTFITNQHDPVPTVPPELIGYRHSSGEVHIQSGNATVACPGQENGNCSDGNSLLQVSIANHIGPYFANISMSHSNCPL